MDFHSEQIVGRLLQLRDEILGAHRLTYYERLWTFANYCQSKLVLKTRLETLSNVDDNLQTDLLYPSDRWPEGEPGNAYRWNAIKIALEGYAQGRDLIQMQAPSKSAFLENSYAEFTRICFIPLLNYLIDDIRASNNMFYLLLRYKRWVEWFEDDRLNNLYQQSLGNGESLLDEDLRKFLFDNGIDYPFSQPRSPGGQADIVAGLETDDPLVLEVKIWDTNKRYRENRIRDGLRQVIDYAAKYGKSSGYVVVFNADPIPLRFVDSQNPGFWPACLESGSTYYFIAVDIALREKPVSQHNKGKRVQANFVRLETLLE